MPKLLPYSVECRVTLPEEGDDPSEIRRTRALGRRRVGVVSVQFGKSAGPPDCVVSSSHPAGAARPAVSGPMEEKPTSRPQQVRRSVAAAFANPCEDLPANCYSRIQPGNRVKCAPSSCSGARRCRSAWSTPETRCHCTMRSAVTLSRRASTRLRW